jgi:hypothetical protein
MKNYDLMEKPKESANSARMDRSEALQGVAEDLCGLPAR